MISINTTLFVFMCIFAGLGVLAFLFFAICLIGVLLTKEDYDFYGDEHL